MVGDTTRLAIALNPPRKRRTVHQPQAPCSHTLRRWFVVTLPEPPCQTLKASPIAGWGREERSIRLFFWVRLPRRTDRQSDHSKLRPVLSIGAKAVRQ